LGKTVSCEQKRIDRSERDFAQGAAFLRVVMIASALKFLVALIFLVAINSLTR